MKLMALVTLLLFLLPACMAAPQTEVTRLDSSDVIVLAEKKAEEEGLKLEFYELPKLTYDFKERVWLLLFREKEFSGTFGAHFGVQVFEGEEIEVVMHRGL